MNVNGVYKPTYNWGGPSCRGYNGDFRDTMAIMAISSKIPANWTVFVDYPLAI